jgi:flavin reductase (DIM6/NTAB) family NADH-FMN oxidoreductase RutF
VTTPDELRAAMRRFPSGIAVVTTEVEDQEFGVTVASLVSFSLDPPLLGVSIGVDTHMHSFMDEAHGFTVSLLAGDQEGVAQHFARAGVPPLARWIGVATEAGTYGRRISGALAWLECRAHDAHRIGDHTLFVAEVEEVELGRDADGLAYLRSEYRAT